MHFCHCGRLFFVCHSSCAVPKSPQYQKVKVHNRQTTGRHVRPVDCPLSRMLSLWHVELRTAHKVARNATITVQNHQQHTNRAVHVYNARRPPAHAQRSLWKKWVLFLFAIAVRRVVCLVFMAIAPDMSEDPDTNETRPISFTLWSLCLCHGAAAVTAVAVAKNPQFSAILDFIGGPATVPRTFYTNVTRARARRNRNGMPCDIIILSYILLAWLCYTHSLPECMEMTDHNRVLCMLTVFAYVTYINFRILWLWMVATKAPYQIAIGHFRVVMCIQKHTVNIIHFCGHPKMGCFLFEKWRMLACSSERINEQYLYLLVMSVCHLKEEKTTKKWPERN